MIIRGKIEPRDYHDFNLTNAYKQPVWFRWICYLFYPLTVAVLIVIGKCYDIDPGISVQIGILMVLWYTFIGRQLNKLGMKLYQTWPEKWNCGDCIYELRDDAIYFTGSTFNCIIPYKSIRGISDGKYGPSITFSRGIGFLLPRRDMVAEGNIDDFANEIKKRLPTDV